MTTDVTLIPSSAASSAASLKFNTSPVEFFTMCTTPAPPSTALVSGGGSGRRLFVRHGFLDRLLDDSRVGEVVIGERRQRGADQAGDEIDGDVLGPEGRAARDRLHELGAERARRVE